VSLRETLKSAKLRRRKQFDGLTRLDGCALDLENHDILLWGQSERGQPELFIDDFIIALRASAGSYGRLEPAISIDPDREVMRRLDQIGSEPSDRQRFAAICSQPQTVRVDGMPRHTRVSKVLVDADYRMKQVAQGHVRLPLSPAFSGTFASRLQQAREQLRSGEFSPGESSRRFWFQAGPFDYGYDPDVVTLHSAQLVLNEEDDRDGVTANTRTEDSISKDFACNWTARMEETYRAEPIWRDMYNVYRHFALAKIMQDERVFTGADFIEVRALVEGHQIDHVEVPATVHGLSRWEVIQHSEGRRRVAVTSKVCGGVSLGFSSRVLREVRHGFKRQSALWRAIVSARPDQTSMSWPITPAIIEAAVAWHEAREKEEEARSAEYEAERRKREEEEKFGAKGQWWGLALFGSLLALGGGVGWICNRRPEVARVPRKAVATVAPSGAVTPVARNALCPCNSGKRYKHCHGAYTT
jgi:hypothetical protein